MNPSHIDDLRAAYFGIPTGEPTAEQLADAAGPLISVVGRILRDLGRVCDVCGGDHHGADWRDIAHDDIAAILRELDLGDHARPISTHAVVHDEILPTIARLTSKEER